MTEPEKKAELSAHLQARSDDELRTLISEAGSLLERREQERKNRALAEIRKIASDNGLAINVTARKKKKRGRPPKEKAST